MRIVAILYPQLCCLIQTPSMADSKRTKTSDTNFNDPKTRDQQAMPGASEPSCASLQTESQTSSDMIRYMLLCTLIFTLTNAHPYVRVLVVLATGFDEVETVTVVHVLRAAGAHVTLASLSPGKLLVRGAHMLRVKPDVDLLTGPTDPYDAVILPGGEAAVELMSASEELGRLLIEYEKYNKYIGAMGVSALALQQHRIAYGALLTADPRVENKLSDFYGFIASDDVVVDKTLVTCTGPGSAMQFALEMVELLFDKEKAERLSKKLLYRSL